MWLFFWRLCLRVVNRCRKWSKSKNSKNLSKRFGHKNEKIFFFLVQFWRPCRADHFAPLTFGRGHLESGLISWSLNDYYDHFAFKSVCQVPLTPPSEASLYCAFEQYFSLIIVLHNLQCNNYCFVHDLCKIWWNYISLKYGKTRSPGGVPQPLTLIYLYVKLIYWLYIVCKLVVLC